eukprot:4577486-Pyramimonas_sp.AAC.1
MMTTLVVEDVASDALVESRREAECKDARGRGCPGGRWPRAALAPSPPWWRATMGTSKRVLSEGVGLPTDAQAARRAVRPRIAP